ncbi:unnamed protein product [Prorocentrum cordatum]|uniref:Uncharacterized protein n=1 Tax=Prorocentrum cordatum TaxID=2364126 RepID=A0ABN9PUW2_9DINO|nr:unnamed protein product [Polarella glacialis]
MECKFATVNSLKHNEQLHDGELVEQGKVKEIFKGMVTTHGQNKIVGKAVAPKPADPAPGKQDAAGKQQDPPREKMGKADAEEEDDDTDGEAEWDLLGMLDGGDERKASGAGSSAAASSSAIGGSPSAATDGAGSTRTRSAKAKAKGKAAPGNAPPPLTKTAGTGGARRAASGGAPAVAGDRAERDAKMQHDKLSAINREFGTLQRVSVLALDKKHFKVVKHLVESLQSKMRVMPKALQVEVTKSLRLADCHGKITRAHKTWARKSTTADFLAELKDVEEIASNTPKLELGFPECIEMSIIEMKFNADVVADRVNDALIDVVTVSGDKAPKQKIDHLRMVSALLAPIPEEGASFPSGVHLHEDLTKELRVIKQMFDVAKYDQPKQLDAVSDLEHVIKRGSSDTHKIFSATGAGDKLRKYARAVLSEHDAKLKAMDRVSALLKSEPSLDVAIQLDSELSPFKFADKA